MSRHIYTYMLILSLAVAVAAPAAASPHTWATYIHGHVTWINMTVDAGPLVIEEDSVLTLINTTLRVTSIYLSGNATLEAYMNSTIEPGAASSYYRVTGGSNATLTVNASRLTGLGMGNAYGIEITWGHIAINGSTVSAATASSARLAKLGGGTLLIENSVVNGYNYLAWLYGTAHGALEETVFTTAQGAMSITVRDSAYMGMRGIGLLGLRAYVSGGAAVLDLRDVYVPGLRLTATMGASVSADNLTAPGNGYLSILYGSSVSMNNYTVGNLEATIRSSNATFTHSAIGVSPLGGFRATDSRIVLNHTTLAVNPPGSPVVLDRCGGSVIVDTAVTGAGSPLIIRGSPGLTIRNVYAEEGLYLHTDHMASGSPGNYRHVMENVSSANGEILYIRNATGTHIDARVLAGLYIVDSTGITVTDTVVTGNGLTAVAVVASSNTVIRGTTIDASDDTPQGYRSMPLYILGSNNTILDDTVVTGKDTSSGSHVAAMTIHNLSLRDTRLATQRASYALDIYDAYGAVEITGSVIETGYGSGVAMSGPGNASLAINHSNIDAAWRGIYVVRETGEITVSNTSISSYDISVKISRSTRLVIMDTVSTSQWTSIEAVTDTLVIRNLSSTIISGTRNVYVVASEATVDGVVLHGRRGTGLYIYRDGGGSINISNVHEEGHDAGIGLWSPRGATLRNITLEHGLTVAGESPGDFLLDPSNVSAAAKPVRYYYNETLSLSIDGYEAILVACNATITDSHTAGLTHTVVAAYSNVSVKRLIAEDAAMQAIYSYGSDIAMEDTVFTGGKSHAVTAYYSRVHASNTTLIDNNGFNGYRTSLWITGLSARSSYSRTAVYGNDMVLVELTNASCSNYRVYVLAATTGYVAVAGSALRHGGTEEILYISGHDTMVTIADTVIEGRIRVYGGRVVLDNVEISSIPGRSTVSGDTVVINNTFYHAVNTGSDTSIYMYIYGSLYTRNFTAETTLYGVTIENYGPVVMENTSIRNQYYRETGWGVELKRRGTAVFIDVEVIGYYHSVYADASGTEIYILNSTLTGRSVACYHPYRETTWMRMGNTRIHGFSTGLILYTGDKLYAEYLNMTGNGRGVIIRRGGEAVVHMSSIHGNTGHGAYVYSGGSANLSMNYWGGASGPEYKLLSDPDDPEEVYSQWGDGLTYQPYLEEPPSRDNVAPWITVLGVADATLPVHGTINITYSGGDNEGVFLVLALVDGRVVAVDDDGNGSLAVDTVVLGDGPHVLTITIYDYAGNQATEEITLLVDNTAPEVAIEAPLNSSVVGGNISVSATVIDAGNVSSRLLLDGAEEASSTGNAPVYLVDTRGLADGPHNITVNASDAAGNTGWASITVVVDNTAPTARIHMANDTLMAGAAETMLSFNDTHLANATLYIDGVAAATWLDSGAVAYLLDTRLLSDGAHTMVLRAVDEAGNTVYDARVFHIDNTGPAIMFAYVEGNNTGPGRVLLRLNISDAHPGYATVLLDGRIAYRGPYGGGLVEVAETGLRPGVHRVLVVANDTLGNNASRSLVIVVANTPTPEPPLLPMLLLAALAAYVASRIGRGRRG